MNAMVHAAGDELSNDFANFSAAYLKHSVDDALSFKENKIKNRQRLRSVKRDKPVANRNISSIVSRIRDEGAAFSHTEDKRDKQTRQNSSAPGVKETPAESAVMFTDTADDDRLTLSSNVNKVVRTPSSEQCENSSKPANTPFSAVCDQPVDIGSNEAMTSTAKSAQKRISKKQISLISIIGFMVIAVFAYMSYQFKLQSDDMKHTLLMYKHAMNQGQSNQIQLNQDKQLVDTVVADKNNLVSVSKQGAGKASYEKQKSSDTRTKELTLVNEKDSVMTERKSELTTQLKIKPVAVIANEKIVPEIRLPAKKTVAVKPLAIIKEAVKKAAEKTYIAADKPVMFTVNLASYSDRVKAYSQLSVFKSLGVYPVIEQAKVASKTIYRLCVEGFSSREEASLFISRLNKKHALNAWVRRG